MTSEWLSIAVDARPRRSADEIATVLLEAYGLEGELTPLPAEVDQNFRLDTHDDRFVVKITNRAEPTAVVMAQTAALDHLAAVDSDLPVPRVIRNRSGTALTTLESTTEVKHEPASSGRPDRLRVMTWLPGIPMASVDTPRPRGLLEEIGSLMGRLDVALAGFDHEGMHRRLKWDLAGAAWISAHTGAIIDVGRRGIVERWLLQCRARVLPRLADLPHGVVHNDGNDENLLVDPSNAGEPHLCGLLDFGDMLFSPTVVELAVAAAYALLDEPDPLEVVTAVAGAYHARRELTAGELEALFPLAGLRLCVSVVSSALAAREEPGNEHRLASEASAWKALENLEGIDWEDASDALLDVCRMDDAARRDVDDRPDRSSTEEVRAGLIASRRRLLGPSLSLAYDDPLHIVRGEGCYLFDAAGRAYLDCVNNVCHVGHSHPRVVEAMARQAALLNTNTRYLHPLILRYAERLTATLPDPLEVCFFVNSGSEANELAVRMALTATGRSDAIVLADAYHGNTRTLVDLSPYKCEGPGGKGLPEWVHKVERPDPYRGSHRGRGSGVGAAYAAEVSELCGRLVADGRGPAFMIAEPILGCGGQVVLPEGYLAAAFEAVRSAGGLCIADEVQVGFGRVGAHWWAFETQGVVPDIVTMGKPIGNGHPIGAVVTTRAIADAFADGMEFFSTFGGNPVSCAVGLAVMDVIEEEGLRERAARAGARLRDGFSDLAERVPLVGDVRGLGMFMGVELVGDRDTLEPAVQETAALVEACRAEGVLVSAEGPHHNVLKIKPPLTFEETEADLLLGVIERTLTSPGR